MNCIKNLLLYISAFMPMYILVLLKLVLELIFGDLSFNVLNTLNLITLLLLIASGIWGLVWNIFYNSDKAKEIVIISKKNITDQHFLGYFSLFVYFAIPLNLSYVSNYCIYVAILVLIGIVYINNSLYYINPLLNLLGFNFYDIEYKEEGSEEVRSAKMFYRGNLVIENKKYFVKLKNTNFSFIDRSLENKKQA